MLLQGLETVHCIKARHVEARNPHIHHDGHAEIALFLLELLVEFLLIRVATQDFAQRSLVVFISGHHHHQPGHGENLLPFLLRQLLSLATCFHFFPFRAELEDSLKE